MSGLLWNNYSRREVIEEEFVDIGKAVGDQVVWSVAPCYRRLGTDLFVGVTKQQ